MGICVFVNAWVYPIVAHWVWGGGFLQQYGVLDFAGSGVVHLTGGTFGLIGALFLKPRKGRFDDKNRELDYS
jgi:Amt family ammonium transporter